MYLVTAIGPQKDGDRFVKYWVIGPGVGGPRAPARGLADPAIGPARQQGFVDISPTTTFKARTRSCPRIPAMPYTSIFAAILINSVRAANMTCIKVTSRQLGHIGH